TPALNASDTPVPTQIQYRFLFEPSEAPPIRLTGTVQEAGVRTPVAKATVRARNDAGNEVYGTTDDEGSYQLAGLENGVWNVKISAPALVPEIIEVTITDNNISELNTYLVRDEVRMGSDEEMVVTALATKTEVAERTLSSEDIRYLPGTGGDVVKVVQNLPGVARAPLGTGQLRIRGTAPEDSLYFLDSGKIPIVFHFSGLTTVVASDLLEEVGYFPGSYGTRFGRALGGLVDLRTSTTLPERSNGYVSIDIYQATTFVQQKYGRHAVTLAGRRSYADAVLNPILNKGSLTVQAPRYYDAQARWSHDGENGWSDVMFLLSDDRFRFLGQDSDEVVLAGFATQFQKLRLLHLRPLSNDVEFESSLLLGPEREFFEYEGTSEAYEEQFQVSARAEFTRPTTPERWLGWLVGTDPNFAKENYLYDIARPPEKTVSTSRLGAAEKGDGNVWMPSIYGEVTAKWGDATITPGFRADAMFVEDIMVSSFDPRIRGRYMIGTNTALKAGAGRHSQFPTIRELLPSSDGNPELNSEYAFQYSAGFEQQIVTGIKLDVTGFYHDLQNLVVGREDRFRFYSGPPPAGPFDTGAYANEGTGRTMGVETLVNIDFQNTSGFVSATVSQSDRIKRPGEERTLFEYDQPLVINALVSQKLPKRWRIGTRVRYGSGNPYTPVVNRIYNHDRREFIPVYGERDSGRLPPFFSLDLRIDKDYVYKKWTLTTYLDIQNATYSKNVETQGYSYDYGEEEPILSNPPLPAFGLRGEW
ncbi:MAG: TonB-dependent receptor, partial [Myxococcota bacterium]